MDGCIGVWWSSKCIHPSTERCLRLTGESSPSLELKANAAQGTTSFLCTSKGIPGLVSPFSNAAVLIPWTGNRLCKGFTCSQCRWNSCLCSACDAWSVTCCCRVLYALGSPSAGPRFGDPWKQSWSKEKTNRGVVTFLLEYYQHTLLPTQRGLGLFLYSCCFLPAS